MAVNVPSATSPIRKPAGLEKKYLSAQEDKLARSQKKNRYEKERREEHAACSLYTAHVRRFWHNGLSRPLSVWGEAVRSGRNATTKILKK